MRARISDTLGSVANTGCAVGLVCGAALVALSPFILLGVLELDRRINGEAVRWPILRALAVMMGAVFVLLVLAGCIALAAGIAIGWGRAILGSLGQQMLTRRSGSEQGRPAPIRFGDVLSGLLFVGGWLVLGVFGLVSLIWLLIVLVVSHVTQL